MKKRRPPVRWNPAERSLPPDIADMTPNEREAAITESLARGEKHLLAALGEMYRSYRLVTQPVGQNVYTGTTPTDTHSVLGFPVDGTPDVADIVPTLVGNVMPPAGALVRRGTSQGCFEAPASQTVSR